MTARIAAHRSIAALFACASPSIRATVREALLLRALATALLRRAPDAVVAEAAAKAGPCSVRAWRTFLIIERCAIWLADQLTERKVASYLSAEANAVLREVREVELRRVLTARGQIAQLARMAAESELQVIVLKGGVAAVAGSPMLDLYDLDVLTDAGSAEALALQLDAHGYAPAWVGEAHGHHHLAPRAKANQLMIEIHRTLPWANAGEVAGMVMRAQTMDGCAPLLRLSAPDQLWCVLAHTALHHVDRCASIRDQLLIRSAVEECTAVELAQVQARMRSHDAGELLRSVLSAALSDAALPVDPFVRVSAARYAATAAVFSKGTAAPLIMSAPLKALTLNLTAGSGAYWRGMARVARSGRSIGARLRSARNQGVVADSMLAMLGTLRFFALTPPAALLALQGARAARRFEHPNWSK